MSTTTAAQPGGCCVLFLLGYIVRVDLDQGMVELGSVRDREEY